VDEVELLPRKLPDDPISAAEVRYLFRQYDLLQNVRQRAVAQSRYIQSPRVDWLGNQSIRLERQLTRILEQFAKSHPVGQWMLGIRGIGPIIAAGFLAYIDIEKAPTAASIWRYAGLDPTLRWDGSPYKRKPWNAQLKSLAWKAGANFVRAANSKDCYYGTVYRKRKLYEQARNDAGENEGVAKALAEKYRKNTKVQAYKDGKLPPAQIEARARRYAVKLFISHLHTVWYRHHFHKEPPAPYPIAHLGHAHYLEPPAIPAAELSS
jgi:hypothetical protein